MDDGGKSPPIIDIDIGINLLNRWSFGGSITVVNGKAMLVIVDGCSLPIAYIRVLVLGTGW